ncbi:MAG: metallophosphoesterase [Planctomycetes bacterium]|nr:metallophosphoesterase [Planctomycetota bacterium]
MHENLKLKSALWLVVASVASISLVCAVNQDDDDRGRNASKSGAATPEFHKPSTSARKNGSRKTDKDPLAFVKGPFLGHVDAESVMVSAELSKVGSIEVVVRGDEREWTFKSEGSSEFHEMKLDGFEPGNYYTFEYKVVSGEENLIADGRFRTAPTRDQKYRFGIYGDSRSVPAVHKRICDEMLKFGPDMVVNTGDVCGNGDEWNDWQIEHFEPARELMMNAPYYIAIGNHERNSKYFYQYFSYPTPENYFAFTYGNARFIIVDSNFEYESFAPSSTQFMWLRDQLESSVDNDFVFVFFHHPPWSEGWDSPGYSGEFSVRGFLVPLFKRYRPDIVFNGHTHDYERGYRDGTYYVITGGGGSGLDLPQQDFEHVTVARYVHHFVLVDVEGDKIHYQVRGLSDTLIEELYLEKSDSGLVVREDDEDSDF